MRRVVSNVHLDYETSQNILYTAYYKTSRKEKITPVKITGVNVSPLAMHWSRYSVMQCMVLCLLWGGKTSIYDSMQQRWSNLHGAYLHLGQAQVSLPFHPYIGPMGRMQLLSSTILDENSLHSHCTLEHQWTHTKTRFIVYLNRWELYWKFNVWPH